MGSAANILKVITAVLGNCRELYQGIGFTAVVDQCVFITYISLSQACAVKH